MKKWLGRLFGGGKDPAQTTHTHIRVREEATDLRIPADKLRLGMRVTGLDRPWEETPFLLQGFVVNRLEDLQTLRDLCQWVTIDARKEVWSKDVWLDGQGSDNAAPAPPSRTLLEELPRSVSTYRHLKSNFQDVLSAVKQSELLDIKRLKPIVDQCVDSLMSNPSALFWLTRIKNSDEYTAEHSLRVCILAISLGRELGYKRRRLEVVGLGALLHDVGKMKVPDHILNKPGSLTDEEMVIMRQHSAWGAELIAEQPGLPDIIIQAVRHHHEHMNGNGYPDKFYGDQIPIPARLVSVVDAYDAMTSTRCYKSAMTSMEALSILYNHRAVQFDADMVEAFIKVVGVYPPGSLVELASGEVGIVVNTLHSRLRPNLMLQLDRDKKPTTNQIIDMSHPDHQSLTIVRSLPNDAYGLNMPSIIKQLQAQAHGSQPGL